MKKQSIYRWLRHIGAIATCFVALLAQGSEQEKFADARARLEAGLSIMVGSSITMDRIAATESDQLIEVSIKDGPVLYATRSGEFLLLNGDLLRVTNTEVANLTETRRVADRLSMIGALDLDEMIVFSPAEPAKDFITVFTDIPCGYCRKFHH